MKLKEYKSLLVILVISIIIVLIFNLAVREKLRRDEAFSAVYFQEHKKLPDRLIEGEEYSVKVGISNNELKSVDYYFEVESEIDDFTQIMTLEPGKSKVIDITISADEGEYGTIFKIVEENTYLFDRGVIGRISENIFIRDIEEDYLPVSFNLGPLGEIYHVNLEEDDMPFHRTYDYSIYEKHGHDYTEEITFNSIDGRFMADTIKTDIFTINMKKPFIVKVYKEKDAQEDELEVHFWYEIV